ncbi:MAG TPA: helix-turn-helix domain-containing protein [Streptosporangiaceae bacterium]|nr:helix-turn-helix domain-containing protein [Streptosporangiaceae bacterium]
MGDANKKAEAAERLEAWRAQVVRALGPVEINPRDPERFDADASAILLGNVAVSVLTASPCQGRRTPKMIRQYDPEVLQLVLPTRGNLAVSQSHTDLPLRSTDFALYGTSYPWEMHIGANVTTLSGIVATFPYNLFPFPVEKIARLSGFPAYAGIGALLRDFVLRIVANPAQYSPADLPRLGMTLTDLLATHIAGSLDSHTYIPLETHQRAVLVQIYAFIERNLANSNLDPEMIAAANSISVRSLHRYLRSEGTTVAAWVREQRLRRCHRDLVDPALTARPISAIARSWGFTDPAHFSRAFRRAYGRTPQEHRNSSRIPAE